MGAPLDEVRENWRDTVRRVALTAVQASALIDGATVAVVAAESLSRFVSAQRRLWIASK